MLGSDQLIRANTSRALAEHCRYANANWLKEEARERIATVSMGDDRADDDSAADGGRKLTCMSKSN